MFRKKTIFLLYSILFSISLFAQSNRNIISAEYFWDTDPGQGSATSLVAFDGSFNQAVEDIISSSTIGFPTGGPHVFNIRVQDEDGTWSPAFKRVIDLSTPSQLRDLKITTSEYFWDSGSANTLIAFDGSFNGAIEDIISAATISFPTGGPHVFSIRVQDEDGNWSPDFKRVIDLSTPSQLRDLKITSAEYFWDSGNPNALIAFDGNFDSAIEDVISAATISFPTGGPHVFSIRVQDEDGNWSPDFKRVIDLSTPSQLRDLKITSAEYFWDSGSANTLIAFDGNFDSAIEDIISAATISFPTGGPHVFNIRVQDEDGNWSPAFKRVIDLSTPSQLRDLKITTAEYFWDNASPNTLFAFDGNFDQAIEDIVSYSSIVLPTSGPHVFNIRVQDEDGNWSPNFRRVVSFESGAGCTDSLALNYNPTALNDDSSCCYISGCIDIFACNYDTLACFDDGSCLYNSSSTVSVTECDTYTWNGATYTTSGIYTFSSINSVGCDSIATLDLTINNSSSSTDIQVHCDAYTWVDGVTYTTSNNTATYMFQTLDGCDSLSTLDLTINYSSSSTDIQVHCDAYTWVDGVTYTTSNNTATYMFQTLDGCDSLSTLDLTINYSSSSTDIQVHCDAYTWVDGITYTASNNTATMIYTNTVGCDSTVTLDLTINYSTTSTETTQMCFSYNWNGQTYDTTGIYTYSTLNSLGCDSTATLYLTINEPVVDLGDDIYACDGDTITIVDPLLDNTHNFSWASSQGQISNLSDLDITISDTYYLTVTDTFGCIASDILVAYFSDLSISMSQTPSSCSEWHDGSVAVSTTDGIPPFYYSWSTGDNTAQVDQLGMGTYLVSVTDSGCVLSDSIVVELNTAPADSMHPEICYVSVDNTGFNRVVLSPLENPLTSQYVIYREYSAN